MPYSIASASDGALWFTESSTNKIGRITTAGTVLEFAIPSVASFPEGIVSGPDSALWFAESNANKIGRSTTTGMIAEYELPTLASVPTSIASGPDGALWFVESGVNKIGRITTGGSVSEYPLPNQDYGHEASALAPGPDGAIWFTESSFTLANIPLYTAAAIGRISGDGAITEYPLPMADSVPGNIALGSDKALWFTDRTGIGRITTSGSISHYLLNAQPYGITVGPDGAIWSTEAGNGKSAIARISSTGDITSYSPPASLSGPGSIATGPDGALWFTAVGNIGRLH